MILCPNSRAQLSAIGVGLILAGCSLMSRLSSPDGPAAVTEHVRKGMALEEAGELERALTEYETARAVDEDNPGILIGLGNVHAQLKQFPEAEKYYRDALRLDPESAMANNNLAWIYVIQGAKLSEAEGLIRKAMYADPGRVSVYFDSLAYLYLRQERYSEALDSLKAAENLRPPDDEALAAQLANTRSIIFQAMDPERDLPPEASEYPPEREDQP